MKHEVDILDRIYERIEADGFDALTDCERYYFAIWWLEGEAGNGSFDQYFCNSSGEFAHGALQGLKAVGAHQMAEIFEAAINLFPNAQVPTGKVERNKVLDTFTPAQKQQLDKLSGMFTDYPDDLALLLDNYVEEHQKQFLGPTTLLELWHARRARGADTVPHRISNWNLDEEAEKDALATNRKCPICEQPASNYRKTCKKCGYPVGRVIQQQ